MYQILSQAKPSHKTKVYLRPIGPCAKYSKCKEKTSNELYHFLQYTIEWRLSHQLWALSGADTESQGSEMHTQKKKKKITDNRQPFTLYSFYRNILDSPLHLYKHVFGRKKPVRPYVTQGGHAD